MKKRLINLLIVLAAASASTFSRSTVRTKKHFAIYTFSFIGNASLRSDVEDPTKWMQGLMTCNGGSQVPCRIQVTDEYTHDLPDGDGYQILNTPSNTPLGESYISIQTEYGYLNTIPEPDVQYYRVSNGIGYIFQNKSF